MPGMPSQPIPLEPAAELQQAVQRPGFARVWESLEACLRSPTHSPSFATLRKYAHACGKPLVITMVLTTPTAAASQRQGRSLERPFCWG